MQKEKNKLKCLSTVISNYKEVGAFFIASCSFSFWLGTYYKEVMMTREIIELDTKHQKEYLEQKENYLKAYYELKEKYIDNLNDTIHGK